MGSQHLALSLTVAGGFGQRELRRVKCDGNILEHTVTTRMQDWHCTKTEQKMRRLRTHDLKMYKSKEM
jgi:hypothetical protein